MDTLLSLKGLTKRFGPTTVVDNITFDVGRGEVLGFLGPNGAGKSTTMRMVAGYLAPSAGSVTICGFDVDRSPIKVRERLGYLPEGAPAYAEMTPGGILQFVAGLRGLRGKQRDKRLQQVTERLELQRVLPQPIETLSKGFKRRVGLALALLHDPEVLILDEPTDGLDPNQKHQVRQLLSELAAEKAIIISTHILEEVDALCTRAIIIARGKVVADATPAELLARSAVNHAVCLHLAASEVAQATAALGALPQVAQVREIGRDGEQVQLLVLPCDGGRILEPVQGAIIESGFAIEEIYQERGRLDDVFRELTKAA